MFVKRMLATLAATALCLGGTVAIAATANASCDPSAHCYSLAEYNASSPSGFEGDYVTFRTNCWSNPSSDSFFDNETWVAQSATGLWVEAGLTYGIHHDGQITGKREFFDGWQPAGSPFNAWYYTPEWNYGSYYSADIFEYSPGGGNWQTNVNGHTDNFLTFHGPALQLQAGNEIKTPLSIPDTAIQTYGSVSNMQFYDLSGTLRTTGWSTTSGHAVLTHYNKTVGPLIDNWASMYDWVRTGMTATC